LIDINFNGTINLLWRPRNKPAPVIGKKAEKDFNRPNSFVIRKKFIDWKKYMPEMIYMRD